MNESAYKYSVIVPCFNEAWVIRSTVARMIDVLSEDVEIILVDDGSSDTTSEIIREMEQNLDRVIAIVHEVNKGKGESVRSGVLLATGKYIGFIDADLEIDPIHLKEYFNILENSTSGLVIGSKWHSDANIGSSWHRKQLSNIYHMLVRLFFGLPVRDTQVGIKVFTAPIAQDLFSKLTTAGHAFDVELLVHASIAKYHIQEMPVRIVPSEKKSTVSFCAICKMVRDTMQLYRHNIKNLMRMRRFIVLYPLSFVFSVVAEILLFICDLFAQIQNRQSS